MAPVGISPQTEPRPTPARRIPAVVAFVLLGLALITKDLRLLGASMLVLSLAALWQIRRHGIRKFTNIAGPGSWLGWIIAHTPESAGRAIAISVAFLCMGIGVFGLLAGW